MRIKSISVSYLSSMKTIVLVGAGGHGVVALDALRHAGFRGKIQFRDERLCETTVAGVPVRPLAPLAWPLAAGVHVAIGCNEARERILSAFERKGARAITIVHPAATVAILVDIGPGTLLAAQSVVGPRAEIGRGCIVNHSAVVDHDCRIGDFVHVAPGAVLGGGVMVGGRVLVGAGAVVLPGLTLGAGCTVGAGAVVTRNVAPRAVVVGVPAKARRLT